MRKIIYLTILITIVYKWCVLGNIRLNEENRVSASPIGGWAESKFIAHALGGVEGFHNTNSYEAFVSNYLKGYRLFETDLVNTADGELIEARDFSKNKARKTVEQFQGSLIMEKFHSRNAVAMPAYRVFVNPALVNALACTACIRTWRLRQQSSLNQ